MKGQKIVLSVLFLVLSIIVNAQFYEDAIYDHMDYLRHESLVDDFNPKAYSNIRGTPFLTPDFVDGLAVLKTGEKWGGRFRYDVYADQMQFVAKENVYVVAFPEKLSLIRIEELEFKYVPFRIDAMVKNGYFISLVDGQYSLFTRKGKTLKDPTSAKPYQQPQPAKFIDRKDFYYLKIGDMPAVRVNSKKDFIKQCGNTGSEVAKYMKEERINIKSKSDLVKLTTYINKNLL